MSSFIIALLIALVVIIFLRVLFSGLEEQKFSSQKTKRFVVIATLLYGISFLNPLFFGIGWSDFRKIREPERQEVGIRIHEQPQTLVGHHFEMPPNHVIGQNDPKNLVYLFPGSRGYYPLFFAWLDYYIRVLTPLANAIMLLAIFLMLSSFQSVSSKYLWLRLMHY